MNCQTFDNQVDEFIDGELPSVESRAMRAHAAACARCRRTLAAARRLREGALALPDSREPPRDLWPDIAVRLAPRNGPRALRAQPWFRAVAAGLAVAAVFLGGMLTDRLMRDGETGPARVAGQPSHTADRDLPDVGEARRLLPASYVELIEGGRGTGKDTERALLRNLMLVNLAIREVEAAAAEDPGNNDLRQLLAGLYAQENRILSQAERLRVEQSATTRTGI